MCLYSCVVIFYLFALIVFIICFVTYKLISNKCIKIRFEYHCVLSLLYNYKQTIKH